MKYLLCLVLMTGFLASKINNLSLEVSSLKAELRDYQIKNATYGIKGPFKLYLNNSVFERVEGQLEGILDTQVSLNGGR